LRDRHKVHERKRIMLPVTPKKDSDYCRRIVNPWASRTFQLLTRFLFVVLSNGRYHFSVSWFARFLRASAWAAQQLRRWKKKPGTATVFEWGIMQSLC